MTYTYSWANADQTSLKRVDAEGYTLWINAEQITSSEYQEFLESGAVAAAYVAPPEPTPLTTEQKIARAGFDEGELEDFLVAKIQQRLNE